MLLFARRAYLCRPPQRILTSALLNKHPLLSALLHNTCCIDYTLVKSNHLNQLVNIFFPPCLITSGVFLLMTDLSNRSTTCQDDLNQIGSFTVQSGTFSTICLCPFSIIRAIQLSSRKTNSVWVCQITLRNCYLSYNSHPGSITSPPFPPPPIKKTHQ